MPDPRLNGVGAGAARSIPLGDDWISRRLRELDERITQNLAAMRVMVEPLAQAIADLQAQQASIAALVSEQVSGAAASGNEGPFTPSGTSSRGATSLTVPAGYTRAIVIAISSLSAANPSAIAMATRIAGNDGLSITGLSATTGTLSLSTSHSRSLTGLSGGGSIGLSTTVTLVSGGGNTFVTTTAMAIFLR